MRKISYILCLTLILSVFAISPVSHAENLNAEVFCSIGAEFLDVMNIADPVAGKASDYNVTRAEAITAFVNLFGYNASGEADVPFTDVKGELTGVLRYALDLKMISESVSFRPNDTITYNEAYKMCTAALGYDYLAKMYGGWPAGYVRVAGECNLSNGLPASEKTISKDGFYLFVENLLTAEMLEVDGMVNNEISYRKHTTVLEMYFNLYEIEGIVTANAHTGLYSLEDATDESIVYIDDHKYNCEGSSNFIGRNVKAYADNDKIVVMVPADNKTLSVNFSDITSADGNQVYYDNGSKEIKIRTESVPAFIYNGKCLDTGKVSDYIGKNGYFTFVDNDGDNVYEVCEANEYRTVVVSGVNVIEGYITDKNGERKIDLSDDECTYFIYENGKEITLSDIKTGCLLTYCISKDSKLVSVTVEPATISGTLTGFRKNAIVIDDVAYTYSDYFEKYYLSRLKSGQQITAMISSIGVVEASSEPEKENIVFGYYLDVTTGKGLDTNLSVKFVSNKGDITITGVADKIVLNGETYSNASSINNIFYNSDGSKKLEEQVIRYKLNSEGDLCLLDTIGEEGGYISSEDNFEDNLTKYVYPASGDLVHDGIWLEKATDIVHPWYAVTSATFLIQINSDTTVDEEKRFAVRDLAWFRANPTFTREKVSVYNVDEYLCAGAIIFDTVAEDNVTDESPLGIVYSVTKALDPELNESYKLVIYRNNYYYDLYVSDIELVQSLLYDEEGNMKVAPGDCVRYEADSQGYIAALEVDYDYSADKLLHKNSNQMYLCYYYGGVYSMGNGIVTMVRAKEDGTLDIDHQKYAFKDPGTVVIYDSRTGEVLQGSTDEFETYLQAGDDCTRIMFVTDSMENRLCVMYR